MLRDGACFSGCGEVFISGAGLRTGSGSDTVLGSGGAKGFVIFAAGTGAGDFADFGAGPVFASGRDTSIRVTRSGLGL